MPRRLHGSCLEPLFSQFSAVALNVCINVSVRWRAAMQDLAYVVLTIAAFAVLWLIVKGVEHFER